MITIAQIEALMDQAGESRDLVMLSPYVTEQLLADHCTCSGNLHATDCPTLSVQDEGEQ